MNSGCNCNWGGCVYSKIGKILLVIGGLNWGLVGIAMLMNNSMDAWNVVHQVLGSWPVVEAVVYVLVGIAAVMKLIGCKCKKCMAACASCNSCQAGGSDQSM